MPDQIVLEWTVDVANTTLGPTAAAAALAAVTLYESADADPVLGQYFGLCVASDNTMVGATSATRTLTLNMNAANSPKAPPVFPCNPRTSTPPVLPYPLRRAVTLPGSFFVTTGSMSVDTTATQLPSLPVGTIIQFLSQRGVFYTVASVNSTTVGLTAPYTGNTANTGAFKDVADPATIVAVFSTSDQDTAGVATDPAIPPGSGARTLSISYNDSNGMGATVSATLTGKRPAAVPLSLATVDIAEITGVEIASSGGFGNSVGQITIVSLESALPAIEPDATPEEFFGDLTDEAQLLIDRHLVYMTQSYFSLAGQTTSRPQLTGDFFVTTGSTNVPTAEDQTSALAATDLIEFAAQPGKQYEILAVTAKIVTLTEVYSGIDNNNTGIDHNRGVKGNVGPSVINKRTGATLLGDTGTAPSNAVLSTPLGQYLETQVAAPPPAPPLSPATVPTPTFLSGYFTRTIQLALAGVPVTPSVITLA